MGIFSHKKLVMAFLLLVLVISIPLTLYLVQRQQDTRSKAAASTTLSFSPPTISQVVGNDVSVDVMIEPGTNLVTYVKLEAKYDPTKLQLSTTNPFTPNTAAFPTQVQAPVVSATNGTIVAAVSIGSDLTHAVQTLTKVGTLNFKAIGSTGSTPATVVFGNNSLVLSSAAADNSTENVLSTTIPTAVTITDSNTVTIIPTTNPTGNLSPTVIPTTGSGTPTPTDILSLTPTLGPTGIGGGPTATPSVTTSPSSAPTPTPTGTRFNLSVILHAIGAGGDNVNPTGNSLSNKDPLHATHSATVQLFNASNQLVKSVSGNVQYASPSGIFTGTVYMTTPLTTGIYIVRVTTDHHLSRRVPGIITLTANQTNVIAPMQYVAGDANSDNALNIKDYNQLMDCYGGEIGPVSCDATKAVNADFNDDGLVNQVDYNLFLREISQQSGD